MKWKKPEVKDYTIWHKFYAWFPVETQEGNIVWLEYVERIVTHSSMDSYDTFREIN